MNTTLRWTFLSIALMVLLLAPLSLAQIPKTISYQGILTDASGTAVPDGNYSLTFKLYDVTTGGTPLWQEVQSVAVSKGIFSVNLGSVDTLNLPFNKPYWLEVTVGAGTELTPRMQLTGSGYSFRAANTDSINGITAGGDLTGRYPNPSINNNAVTSAKIADGAVDSTKIASGEVVKSLNSLHDNVTLQAGSNVSITPLGNTLTIATTPGGAGGDITGVTAGTGLSGGGTTGDVTLNVRVPLSLSGSSASPNSIIFATNSGSGAGVKGYNSTSDSYGYLGGYVSGVSGIHSTSGNYGWLGSSGEGVFGYSGSGYGVYGESNSNDGVFGYSNSGYGVYGYSGSGYGVYGESTSNDGVHGYNNSGNGVYGESNSGYGVYGRGTSFRSTGVYGKAGEYGVYGCNDGSGRYGYLGGQSYGVYGHGTYGVYGDGADYGVYGYSSSGNFGYLGMSDCGVWGSGNPYGVYGYSTTGIAVYGWSSGSSPAGHFEGDVVIVGHLYVGGYKSFKIDHPLDPANKYLAHFCVESDEVLNIYNGNVVTDANGEATVTLPDYFEALNRDFRYQLTVIGQFAQAIVSEEIHNNRFSIKTDKPNVRVSWQVTGIRNDPYVKAHPAQVEVEKTGAERGKYIHPKEYGVSETLGIDYEKNHEMEEQMRAEQEKMKAEQEKMKAEQEKMQAKPEAK
ncbi:MAG: hypothetical protein COS95_03575 [Ignavibacteriales bacterium CG07_land_8_20_14_0_80_59_12]|nr:MAG: hypothetical protein COS95_03575 [Ignavibacteriales bacterium CG07_land_8_20_14_0_80_59_12]